MNLALSNRGAIWFSVLTSFRRLGIKGSFFCGQECFKAGCGSFAHIFLFSELTWCFLRGQFFGGRSVHSAPAYFESQITENSQSHS